MLANTGAQSELDRCGAPAQLLDADRVGARLAGQVQLVVLMHQPYGDAQLTRFDPLDLLAVPLDESLHRWIARQHQRKDGHGALAHHVGLNLAPALSLDPSRGNGYEPLTELLRQWRQQQMITRA